jgi:hypothetical protein
MKYYIGEDFNIATATDLPYIMQELEVENETPDIRKKLKQSIDANICREVFTMFEINNYKENITLYLEEENSIVGFLIFNIDHDNNCIEILYLCSKKKGNGKILLDKIKEFAKKINIPKIVLEVAMVMNPKTYKVDKEATNKLISYYGENEFKTDKTNPRIMVYTVDSKKSPSKKSTSKDSASSSKGKTPKGKKGKTAVKKGGNIINRTRKSK